MTLIEPQPTVLLGRSEFGLLGGVSFEGSASYHSLINKVARDKVAFSIPPN